MLSLKACLHLHVQGDPIENIKYTHRELFEYANKNGFNVLAITCHNKFVWSNEFNQLAKEFNIVVIPGIEQTIQKKHVLILNANIEAEQVKTFTDLKNYKTKYPDCCIIAPHPYHLLPNCLGKHLQQNIDIFDAIEWNYFYSKHINPNKKVDKISKKYNKPIIATSDVHILKHMPRCYTQIQSKTNSVADILEAIKNNKIKIYTKPFKAFELFTTIIDIYRATK